MFCVYVECGVECGMEYGGDEGFQEGLGGVNVCDFWIFDI